MITITIPHNDVILHFVVITHSILASVSPSFRPPGSWFEKGDVLQSRPLPEALHPAWKAQHLPLAATPRPGETLRSGLQHSQPTMEHRGTHSLTHAQQYTSSHMCP